MSIWSALLHISNTRHTIKLVLKENKRCWLYLCSLKKINLQVHWNNWRSHHKEQAGDDNLILNYFYSRSKKAGGILWIFDNCYGCVIWLWGKAHVLPPPKFISAFRPGFYWVNIGYQKMFPCMIYSYKIELC